MGLMSKPGPKSDNADNHFSIHAYLDSLGGLPLKHFLDRAGRGGQLHSELHLACNAQTTGKYEQTLPES